MGFLFHNFRFTAVCCWPQPFTDPTGREQELWREGITLNCPLEKIKLEFYKYVEVLVMCVFLSRDSIVLD